jgi:acetoin utilization deacetylase AcuC-like enzyme
VTLLYTSEVFLEHETGSHPETRRRLEAITAQLALSSVAKAAPRGEILPADLAELTRVHDRSVVDTVARLSREGGGWIDPDTCASAASHRVALAAAGAAIQAVDAVMEGRHPNALCLVRPPGHHATRERSMGFCLFNNVAVAAQRALDRHGAHRVLIVDWDVHHGNGTQDIFYDRDDVVFFSIHRFPFYPGTGSADETGSGQGRGATVNVPVRFGTSRSAYLDLFQRGIERALAVGKPDLVLISAGFDAHASDPVGNLGLATEDYETMTRLAAEIAKSHCQGRIVSCLEGGYNPPALAASVEAHLSVLANEST